MIAGSTPLHFATTSEIAVKQHLANGADVNAKGHNGITPLHHATFEGHKEIAGLLIDNGADVHAKHYMGETPLYNAAYYGSTEVTELLIANGADVNAKDDRGKATARLGCQTEMHRNRRPPPQTRRQDGEGTGSSI